MEELKEKLEAALERAAYWERVAYQHDKEIRHLYERIAELEEALEPYIPQREGTVDQLLEQLKQGK